MEKFLAYMRVVKLNKGLLYYNEGFGYMYSPCIDLYGAPVINFRMKDKSGKEIYGKELSKKQSYEIRNIEKRELKIKF